MIATESIILYLAAAICVIAGIIGIAKSAKPDTKKVMNVFGVILLILGAFFFIWQFGLLSGLGLNPIAPIATGVTQVPFISVAQTGQQTGTPVSGQCAVQATGAYSTVNEFGTESVSGTSYYKEGSDKATTTAKTNLNKGSSYQYWVSNSTYYATPITKIAECKVNPFESKAYQNGSITITGYDLVKKSVINSTDSLTSMAANANAKVEFTIVGAAKTSALPFGGVMVVEYNSTIPTVACSGDGIVGPNSKYQITYSDASTSHTHKVYEVASGFDVSTDGGNTGVTKIIRCDFSNGALGATGDSFYIKFYPANWYLANDGSLYLDVEKKMNSATTKTGYSVPTGTFLWA
jgi:hypothetical protein